MAKSRGGVREVQGAFGRERGPSPIPSSARQEQTELQLLVTNRFFMIQSGVLELMTEAKKYKEQVTAIRARRDEAFASRRDMTPEEATKSDLAIRALGVELGATARLKKTNTEAIDIWNNTFLRSLGVELRRESEETHRDRKSRTRQVVCHLFPEGHEQTALDRLNEIYCAALEKMVEEDQKAAEKEQQEEEGEGTWEDELESQASSSS